MVNVASREIPLRGVAEAQSDPSESGVEYSAEFQRLDAAINTFDAEGFGPLRKGERPFQWDSVASAAEGLLAQSPDLRVAIWLLRSLLDGKGVCGFVEGLARIESLLALPESSLFPRAVDGEPVREAHAVSLSWLGGTALLYQLRSARLTPELALSGADLHQDAALVLSLEPSTKASLAATMQRGLQALDAIIHALQQDGADVYFNVASLRGELEFLGKTLGRQSLASDALAASPASPLASAAQDFSRGPRTRADVQQTLAGLIAYFKEYEPGHPAPLFLQRVQRMLGASFEELMGELYADAKQMIARIEKPQAL